jgi:hypothetical protein
MERPPRARSPEQQGSQRQQATIERRGRSARSLVDDVGEAEVAVLVHGRDGDAVGKVLSLRGEEDP